MKLSELLRRILMIFIIQGFWTNVFIFIVIFTKFLSDNYQEVAGSILIAGE